MLRRMWLRLRDEIRLRRDPVDFARSIGVSVGGDCRFIGISRATFGSEPYLVTIGSHVTITAGVSFITHDGGVWVLRGEHPDIDVVDRITIGDNCFIGLGSILLPGVSVGPDSVVAAGAVVTRDVPPQSVVAGVPARVVSSLDSYRERSLARGLHIRHLAPADKRDAILAALRER